jgi:hypothetical protein
MILCHERLLELSQHGDRKQIGATRIDTAAHAPTGLEELVGDWFVLPVSVIKGDLGSCGESTFELIPFMIILHLELSLFRVFGLRRTFSDFLQTRHFPDRQTNFL